MNLADHAWNRLRSLTAAAPPYADPVARADHATSLADARAALALARGVPVRHVHPASGLDCSPRAYRRVRAEWVAMAEAEGLAVLDVIATALDRWLAAAPHVVAAVEQVDPLTDPYETEVRR